MLPENIWILSGYLNRLFQRKRGVKYYFGGVINGKKIIQSFLTQRNAELTAEERKEDSGNYCWKAGKVGSILD
jgi:hypothetical protein